MTYTLTVPTPDAINVGVAEQAVDTIGVKPVCTDGEVTHCFACFGIYPTYVHYVNSTGEASAQFWSGGTNNLAGARAAAYNPYNNKMYIGGAFMFEVDLNTSPPTFNVIQPNLGVSGDFGVSKGGLVWYTQYSPTRKFFMYNPTLDDWNDYGTPHDAGDYQYSISGVDNTYIYFGCVASSGNEPNSLYWCPISGTTWTAWPYNGLGDLIVKPFSPHGSTDVVIYRRLANSTEKYYTFDGANFDEISNPGWYNADDAPIYCYANAADGSLEGSQLYGWYFDFSALVPIKVVWEYSMMNWDDGGTNYFQSNIAFAGTAFIDNYIHAAIGVDGSNFLALGQGYSAAVDFDPAGSEGNRTTYIGAQVLSPYIIKRHPVSSELYCGGYASKVWRFDPTYPLSPNDWTFNPTYHDSYAPTDLNKPNPYFIDLGAKMLHYRLCIDFDAAGLVWIGGNTVRTGADYGDVMWYDPDTGDSAYMFPSWANTRQVRDLCAADNRSIICVSDDNGQIWLIDAATQTPDGTPYVPVVGGTGSSWMIEVSTDVVLGIYVHEATSTYKVFTFQPSTKTDIVSAQNLGAGVTGFPFGWEDGENNRREFKLELGPDGFVWMFVGNTIYRINPATCEFESVATMSNPAKLNFAENNTDLFLYWNTLNNYYIPGIMIYEGYSKGSYINLPSSDNNLSNIYTSEEIIDVATEDTDMVAQLATSQIAIHQFKQQITGTGGIINAVAQVTIPCSTSTAYLQIYNRSGTPAWETIDSDNATGANTDFTLSASVADLTDYKDENNIVACRIYQEMQ